MLAFPLILPMEWEDSSPPWFCAATKTVTDLANALCSPITICHHTPDGRIVQDAKGRTAAVAQLRKDVTTS
jgi:hypothetical protein